MMLLQMTLLFFCNWNCGGEGMIYSSQVWGDLHEGRFILEEAAASTQVPGQRRALGKLLSPVRQPSPQALGSGRRWVTSRDSGFRL